MGFPTWTLVGMGASALGALIFILIAYLALSPSALLRLGLTGARLDLRIKSFIGYALASLLLMVGFFVAGVPLDAGTETAVNPTPIGEEAAAGATIIAFATPTLEVTAVVTTTTETTVTATVRASGAMGELPPDGEDTTPDSGAFVPLDEEEVAPESEGETTALPDAGPSNTPTAAQTSTAAPETPTATPTPSPTFTPIPTITPTPIDGETAVMALNGGVAWLKRSPGGQNLLVLADEDVVVLANGRANRDGRIWREVVTVEGTTGWIQEIYLNFEN